MRNKSESKQNKNRGGLGTRLHLQVTALKCRTLGASYMISVYACHMCSVLFLPVQSPLTCFRSSLTRFADFVSLSSSSLKTLPQTVGLRLFYISLRSQPPQQQYTVLSFSSMRRHGQSQTDLFTCTMVLHCGHTFLRRIDLLHSIACTTVLHCRHTFLNLS